QVKLGLQFFVLSGLFASAVLSEGIEVTEKSVDSGEENSNINIDNNNEQNNETSARSTNNNATTYKNNWSSAPQQEDLQRIITPVVITSPHAKQHKNFSASPMLDAIYHSEYYDLNHGHYAKAIQKHYSSPKEDDEGQKKQQYSQPLLPDLFLAQKYLHVQQQKDQERSNKQNFQKSALPEAKNNGYTFNSDSISYKPLKFDADPSIVFTSSNGGSSVEKGSDYDNKDVPFKYKMPTQMTGNTHPYPYQNPFSSGGTEMESPTTSSSALFAKEYQGSSWVDGYKTGIKYQEGEKMSMWKKVLNMLAAFIPLGLFLAALPPNVLTINTTQPDLPSRQRSVNHEDSAMSFPILDLLDKYGIDSLDDPECENRIFCEMSRLGGQPRGNIVQKAFWNLAHHIPDKTADNIGMKELFKAVRTDSCEIYRCEEKTPTTIATPIERLKGGKEQ
ncbi:hypothetical protein B7P43_G08984, partial [Cryptotermes secundus]